MGNWLPRLEFLAQALLTSSDRCPHCGAGGETVARKYWAVKVRRCDQCELCFTDPIYQRSKLYDSLYSGEGSTTSLPDKAQLDLLVRTNFAGSDKCFSSRLKALSELAPGPRLLEVGSSWGYFLQQASQFGFDPTGVEISEPRRSYGREQLGLNIHSSLNSLPRMSFDLIYSAHTLEHFTDFHGVLPNLFNCLAPGGLLAVEVPNFDLESRGAEALTNVGAVHPLGFTSEFFQRNLPRVGLEVRGIYESWEDFPERSVRSSSSDVILVLAERPSVESALPASAAQEPVG